MKCIIVLLVVFGLAYGVLVEFEDLYKGDKELYKKGDEISSKGWKEVGKDDAYNVDWYNPLPDDPSLELAFDAQTTLAGIRLVISKESNNDFYKNSKIFAEKEISGKSYYTSTVLFSDPALLKRGRRTTEDDEIVEMVIVKHKDGKLDRIQREACANVNAEGNVFQEQGCKNKYGLVFSPLQKEIKSCEYPLFLVYNEEKKPELLGFGWLVPAGDIKGGKALTEKEIKELLPASPECVKGMTSITIWLAKKDTSSAKCTEKVGEFVEKRCQKKMRGDFEDF